MMGILRSEYTKFYSCSWCMFGLCASILTPPIILFFMGASNEFALQIEDVLVLGLHALRLGQAGAVIAISGFFGQEYDHSCLRTTFLAVSSRKRAMIAKLMVTFSVIVLMEVLSVVFSLTVSTFVVQGELTIDIIVKFISCASGAFISFLQIALIAASIAILTKARNGPIIILIPLIFGLSQVLLMFSNLAIYLPDLATMDLFTLSEGIFFLNKWSGAFIQFLWVLILGIPAWCFWLRRDVR